MNKNKIDHFAGFANLIDKNTIEIDSKMVNISSL